MMRVAIIWSLFVTLSVSLNSSEERRHLLLKCGHLTSNETLMHCFISEMRKLELKGLIDKAIDIKSGAVVSELTSTKITYNCIDESCKEEDSNLSPNTVTISSSKPPPELNVSKTNFWFNAAHLTHYSYIEGAELLLNLKKFRQNHPNNSYVVSLNKYGSGNTITGHFSRVYPYIPINNNAQIDESQWVNIEISSYFFDWRDNPLENHGIQINVAVQDRNGQILFVENLMESTSVVYLEIINPQRIHRLRRHTKNTQEYGKFCSGIDRTCCLYPFNISTAELGLSWIVEPQIIALNYCVGTCSNQSGCCVAEKRSHLEIQYRDLFDGTIKAENISHALIQKCTCL